VVHLPGDSRRHRLRVTVASAAFPKYDRNLNTGGDNERDTRYVVVRQRILHDRAHPSFVRLPVIPREQSTNCSSSARAMRIEESKA